MNTDAPVADLGQDMGFVENRQQRLQSPDTDGDVDEIALVIIPHRAEVPRGRLEQFDIERLHVEPALTQDGDIGGGGIEIIAEHDRREFADIGGVWVKAVA